ncbi:MAG TPA: 3-hydroxyanthranilate 3,4-dioxygenase, partial [Flavobacterium sp.]|nr:3-hydroxyanthranilate 3,4-dioxygenase [Flavobacterium sp.]
FIVMVVGGPNARKDYHYNETDEFFFQLEGTIQVAIQTEKGKEVVTLNAGDVYLAPAKTPHSPGRSEGSVGLVVEMKRENQNKKDGLLWYCDSCNEKLHEVYFELHNIETDFLPHFKHFYQSEALRTCKKCGTVMKTDPRFMG